MPNQSATSNTEMTQSGLTMTKEEKEWRLTTNDHYSEVMKSLMNLITASLVLPIFFVKNFGAKDQTIAQSPDHQLAYWSWGVLGLSLLFGLIFYWMSAKYVKVVSGGEEKPFWRKESLHYSWFETLRDAATVFTVLYFIVGVVLALWFFKDL
jgi:hypothetical protein